MRLAEAMASHGVTLTAAEAARWADAGYLPGEATPLIRDGVTPQTAGEIDELGTELAGGHEQRAMQVIDGLVRDGVLVNPTRVRQQQDPNDPTHVIVHIDHDDDGP
jgi:hypothetical protein